MLYIHILGMVCVVVFAMSGCELRDEVLAAKTLTTSVRPYHCAYDIYIYIYI